MKVNYLFFLMLGILAPFCPVTAQEGPASGALVITEIMTNPAAVDDSKGEWVEIWNSTNEPILINNLVIKDKGSNKHRIDSEDELVIQPGAFWILGREADQELNGGVLVDYVYKSFTLANTTDQVILCTSDERIIDEVEYDSGWPLASGASMELSPAHLDAGNNDDSSAWLLSTSVFGAGDFGTPGRANQSSSIGLAGRSDFWAEVYPNPSHGKFILEVGFPEMACGDIRLVNLVGQEVLTRQFGPTNALCEILEPANMIPGIWFLKITTGSNSRVIRLVIE